MSVDLPISTNASKSKGSTSHNSSPPCSDQDEGSGNKARAPAAESPSPKSPQTNRIITNLSPQGTGPAEPHPPDENLHSCDCYKGNIDSSTDDADISSDVEIVNRMQRAPSSARSPMNVDPPSDDESLDWNVGVIDGIRPPPNKADIVAELTRARSTVSNLPPVLDEPDESPSPGKTGMNATANQTMTDKMSWRALASNQVEVSKSIQAFNDYAMMDNIDDTSQATSPAFKKN